MSQLPADLIRAEATRLGSISFDRYLELALYSPQGFFNRGRGVGHDFRTSPHVGPLFGAIVARAIDREWRLLGEPDPFVVVEVGAGNGRLAKEVLRASPECAKALRYVLVEISDALRAEQHDHLSIEPPEEALGPCEIVDADGAPELVALTGPIVTSLSELPATSIEGIVLANELLDNLVFGLAEFDGEKFLEVRVGPNLEQMRVPLANPGAVEAFMALGDVHIDAGSTVPMPNGINSFFEEASRLLRRGSMILIDYCVEANELLNRGNGWLRTYREQVRGNDPFLFPGEVDITADVVVEHVEAAATACGFGRIERTSQASWLSDLGIHDLVEEGTRIWESKASNPDIGALEAKSRASQAAILLDQSSVASLGNFTVFTTSTTRRS